MIAANSIYSVVAYFNKFFSVMGFRITASEHYAKPYLRLDPLFTIQVATDAKGASIQLEA